MLIRWLRFYRETSYGWDLVFIMLTYCFTLLWLGKADISTISKVLYTTPENLKVFTQSVKENDLSRTLFGFVVLLPFYSITGYMLTKGILINGFKIWRLYRRKSR